MFSFVISALRGSVNGIIVCLYAFMCIAIFAQVMGRYFFGFSIGALVESATFAQVWMVMLGGGVAMRLNMHNSMDLFAQRLSSPVYRALIVLSAAACLWFLVITAMGSQPLIAIGSFQLSPALQIPMSLVYTAIPVGCAYFALEILLFTATRWREGRAPEQTVEQVE